MTGSRNIRLVLAYDGTGYLGWQVQPQGPTVQSVLQEALARITGHPTAVKGSGRTDAGVHALGQVANFHTDSPMPPRAFAMALNSVLPGGIAVLGADEVPPEFDAQFSARSKIYRYRVFNSPVRHPFEESRSWLVHKMIDIRSIRDSASILLGNHDFSTFRASGCCASSPVRSLKRCDVAREGDVISFELEADGFLRHMVRNIVGSLVEVGIGRFSTAGFSRMFAARDRTCAGITAPPGGLYLVRVEYPPPPGSGAAPGWAAGRPGTGFPPVSP